MQNTNKGWTEEEVRKLMEERQRRFQEQIKRQELEQQTLLEETED